MKRKKTQQMSESMLTAVFLTLAGGFQDAYSYNCRGGVFANAQTGNIVLLGQNLAMGKWAACIHYIFPVAAFFAGVYAAERLRHACSESRRLHWRQTVLIFEILLLVITGLLPQTMNVLANIMMSFACAMQVNSFRKVRGLPFATTMCIGNMRSAAELLCRYRITGDIELQRKSLHYFFIIFIFAIGAACGAVLTGWIGNGSIWIAAALLLVGFFLMFFKEEEQIA
ncbi:YoaK family protein [Ructibacterium gallinarum]|uniref:DUF1275 domain-containing protein n=1 Tax=Ructibacterium gallinarum TaxID=2779355 RepID=A0A9D5R969_9FIRM|nr:YoaK family protein [Ructibacterium gallinarum]MBE5040179.1 DUF1275 domain-containing protein [Ructibacterium gallinarum]